MDNTNSSGYEKDREREREYCDFFEIYPTKFRLS